MITFAAIAPHSPILLPNIGKERQEKLQKTLDAYKELADGLYASKPDTILVLSPHGSTFENSFSLFISKTYKSDFSEFGDLKTALEFKSDLYLIDKLQKLRSGEKGIALKGITDEFTNYGTMVPLYFLTEKLPQIKIVPVGNSHLSLKKHFVAGEKIGEALRISSKRIAVIASADLAHTLTDQAPGGFSPTGRLFDETIVQAIRKNKLKKLLNLEKEMNESKACGLRPIAMLLGVLSGFNWTPELLSYEGPFGVGYLVTKFNFK